MQAILSALIALVWLGGTIIRIYRQARFYQIEEYMSRRYLRWVISSRERWLPARPIALGLAGAGIGLIQSEAPGSFLPHLIGLVMGLIAVWPPPEGEIKRNFVRTQRATRLLGAAFAAAIFWLLIGLIFLSRLPDLRSLNVILLELLGLLLFLLAPLHLAAGNLLMTPVEASLRRVFLRRAQKVMKEINPVVIGITGSYGKTTTKHFLNHILSARYRVYATPKSYNTLMGISMVINRDLASDYSIEYFISEMGAYIPGEIERICKLTPPHISIVIEVGPQHLERFGSLENVAIAKYEIIKELPPDGVGVFNWDNPHVREMAERGYPKTRLSVSKALTPDSVPAGGPRFIASNIQEGRTGLTFTVTDCERGQSEIFSTAIVGEHNITNLLLATAVAVHEGMTLREVSLRVRTLQPAESRLVIQRTAEGLTIINDAYSANPVGAVSALRILGMHSSGRRLLITPGMIELGALHEPENQKLGTLAAQYATEIILVGEKQTAPVKSGVLQTHFPPERLHVVNTLSEAVEWYKKNLQSGDTVLFLNDLPDTY